jgi:hypothetical protein
VPQAAADDKKTIRPPPDWGNDKLTDFHTRAFWNGLASYVQMRPAVDVLIDDAVFHKAAENLRHPPDFLGAMLLLRSHSAFPSAAYPVNPRGVAVGSCRRKVVPPRFDIQSPKRTFGDCVNLKARVSIRMCLCSEGLSSRP